MRPSLWALPALPLTSAVNKYKGRNLNESDTHTQCNHTQALCAAAFCLCHATMPPSIIDQRAGRRRYGRSEGALCASCCRLPGVAATRLTNLLCDPCQNKTDFSSAQWSGRIERGNGGADFRQFSPTRDVLGGVRGSCGRRGSLSLGFGGNLYGCLILFRFYFYCC